MQSKNNLLFLLVSLFCIPVFTSAQTTNFNETWKEFLENRKVANIIGLTRPDKKFDQENYAKYLLMNTNSNLCQSDVEGAENLMSETYIPGDGSSPYRD